MFAAIPYMKAAWARSGRVRSPEAERFCGWELKGGRRPSRSSGFASEAAGSRSKTGPALRRANASQRIRSKRCCLIQGGYNSRMGAERRVGATTPDPNWAVTIHFTETSRKLTASRQTSASAISCEREKCPRGSRAHLLPRYKGSSIIQSLPTISGASQNAGESKNGTVKFTSARDEKYPHLKPMKELWRAVRLALLHK